MPVVLRRKSNHTRVKPGDTLTYDGRREIRVKQILEPSHKYGGAGVVAEDGNVYLPSFLGCYCSTEDDEPCS